MAERSYIGTVKSFNPEKGWGHIECDETQALYGKDMFLLRSQFVGMDSVSKGDQVHFMVQDGSKGIEACNIHPITRAGADASASAKGTVKSWNPEKGWGFIECTATHAVFGKDVFMMRSQISGGTDVAKGQMVSFSYEQGPRGPEAVNVKVQGGGQARNHAGGGMGGMGRMGGMGQNAGAMGGCFTGVVKSFDEEKGWGHITCDAARALYQKDMFFMRSALNGGIVMPGDTVQFGLTMGSKGPEASSLIVLAMPPKNAAEAQMQAYGGGAPAPVAAPVAHQARGQPIGGYGAAGYGGPPIGYGATGYGGPPIGYGGGADPRWAPY